MSFFEEEAFRGKHILSRLEARSTRVEGGATPIHFGTKSNSGMWRKGRHPAFHGIHVILVNQSPLRSDEIIATNRFPSAEIAS